MASRRSASRRAARSRSCRSRSSRRFRSSASFRRASSAFFSAAIRAASSCILRCSSTRRASSAARATSAWRAASAARATSAWRAASAARLASAFALIRHPTPQPNAATPSTAPAISSGRTGTRRTARLPAGASGVGASSDAGVSGSSGGIRSPTTSSSVSDSGISIVEYVRVSTSRFEPFVSVPDTASKETPVSLRVSPVSGSASGSRASGCAGFAGACPSVGISTVGRGDGRRPTWRSSTVMLSTPPAAFAVAISASTASFSAACSRTTDRIFLSGTIRQRPSLQMRIRSPSFSGSGVDSTSTVGWMPTARRIMPRNIGLISRSSLAPISSAAEWSLVICRIVRPRMR